MKRVYPIFAAAALLAPALPSATTASGLSNVESDEIEMSYSLLTQEFYKKVDQQTILDGARANVLAYLEKGGVKNPHVADVHAGDDATANARSLEHAVNAAVAAYGTKTGGSRPLTYEAIAGLMSSVKDKYTTFLTPKQYADLNEGLDGGNFSGVGISIAVDEKTKYLDVNEVIPDGPAEKAGVLDGDTILEIDGKTTKGLTTDQDAKLLRGEKGTTVKLSIERAGAAIAPVAVVRDVIHQPSVYSKLMDNGIGYTRLTVFGSNTAQELSAALTKLQMQGAKAYVLDLRDNGGGYLNAASDVSSKFIPSGPIVSVESRGGNDTQYDAENTAIPPKPLAVLVNKYTASASEITSGALQDDGVGELIGEKTYGKGVVQTIHPLPDGSAVKITSARYLTPHGRDINLVGIQPDIVTIEPQSSRLGNPSTDPQLQSAITYLQGKIAQAGS
ncbi:MAG: S41 family peptidase [Candidatus Eremiobacteraeota bacterium]|nr:S41 family peptidase [Candidatus Eremiobacteraeota bacterium]